MSPSRCTVLVVDDEPYILPTVRAFLAGEFDVVTAGSAEEAEHILRHVAIDILLTDQKMPRRSGVELLSWARQHSPRTVRLLMTGYSELEDAVEAINRGSVYYYLLKPYRPEGLLQTIRNAAEKVRLERAREQLLEELRTLNRKLEQRVTERTRELQEANHLLEQRARELERLALTDPLTGLLNRRAMDDLAAFELKRHLRYGSPLALGLVDIDHFKDVNTRFLHTGGDDALRAVSRVLTSSIRDTDSIGRWGGEEFFVIGRETDSVGAVVLAERLRSQVEEAVLPVNGFGLRLTVSVGIAVAEGATGASYDEMCRVAALGVRRAKDEGRNRCVCLTAEGSEIAAAV